MINKRTSILTTMVCLLPIIMAIILYPQLPDTVAIHWDANGNVNGTASKFVATIILPGGLLLLSLFMPVLMKIDPKYDNMGEKIKTVVCWIIPIISVVCSGITLSNAMGKSVPVQVIVPMLLGVIFIIIGNYLPKTKQTYTVGIRIPWTLDNEDNWNKTHRLAGFVWVVGGVVVFASSFTELRVWIITISIAVMVIVPTVYSFLHYKKSR